MTEPAPTTAPPATTPADNRPRTAGKDKTPTVDPEAPYGWMTDPATGQKRPKKRPGRGKTVQAPPNRPATKPRAAKAVATKKTDYRADVMALLDGVWTLGASVPEVDQGTRVFGFDLHGPAVRVKAQAAIMKDNAQGLVNGLGIMAQHSAPVRNFIVKAGDESGPAWILPAMMALLPFVAQSASMWRADLGGEVEALAARTTAEFDELVKGAMRQAEAQFAAETASADMLAAMDAAERSPNGANPAG